MFELLKKITINLGLKNKLALSTPITGFFQIFYNFIVIIIRCHVDTVIHCSTQYLCKK